MKRQMKHVSKRGFTLLELLIVIGIIGLLVTMVAPQLGKMLRRARRTACKANLKGSSSAFHAYSQDHGVFPEARNMPSAELGESDPPPPPPLTEVMSEYVAPKALRCPADNGDGKDQYEPYYKTEGISYEYNTSLGGEPPENARMAGYTWVLRDYEFFHAYQGEDGAMNYLLLDGEVKGLSFRVP